MAELHFFSALLMGLAGGVHCVGMCGGVASAINFAIPKGRNVLPYHLFYNFGRITSYIIAGALVAGLAGGTSRILGISPSILVVISGIFLVLLAGYLANWWSGLVLVEKLGHYLWRFVAPLSKRFLPFKSPVTALFYGAIWGWLPCGLVYSALSWSLLAPSAWHGAWIMFGFGLGTLPALLSLGLGSQWLKNGLQTPALRQIVAIVLLITGLFFIVNPLFPLFN